MNGEHDRTVLTGGKDGQMLLGEIDAEDRS